MLARLGLSVASGLGTPSLREYVNNRFASRRTDDHTQVRLRAGVARVDEGLQRWIYATVSRAFAL